LTFWQRVNTFKALCCRPNLTQNDCQIIIDDANDIMTNFINDGSPFEVNISAAMRKSTQAVYTRNIAEVKGILPSTPPPVGVSSSSSASSPVGASPKSAVPVWSNGTASHGQNMHVVLRVGSMNSTTPHRRNEGSIITTCAPLITLSTVFDESQQVCLNLLQSGPFSRFVTSAIFKTFLDGLRDGDSHDVALERASGGGSNIVKSSAGGGSRGSGADNMSSASMVSNSRAVVAAGASDAAAIAARASGAVAMAAVASRGSIDSNASNSAAAAVAGTIGNSNVASGRSTPLSAPIPGGTGHVEHSLQLVSSSDSSTTPRSIGARDRAALAPRVLGIPNSASSIGNMDNVLNGNIGTISGSGDSIGIMSRTLVVVTPLSNRSLQSPVDRPNSNNDDHQTTRLPGSLDE
jgi:hypothetical protein